MLIRFNVKNFLSFNTRDDGNSEEFSMISGKVRNKKEHINDDGRIKLLKFAALYGANASGKSNLVRAIDFMRHTVIEGLPDGHTDKYCKSDSCNKDKKSYFELEIKLDDKYYSYGFEVLLSQSRFISEWLVELHADNSEKIIFERNIDEGLYKIGSEFRQKGLYDKLNIYADDICYDNSALFLFIINQNKSNLYFEYKKVGILKEIFMWIKEKLIICYTSYFMSDNFRIFKVDNLDEMCNMLSRFEIGINDYRRIDLPIEAMLNRLPSIIQSHIISEIERERTEIRRNSYIDKKEFIMRTNKDLFVVIVDETNKIECQMVEFSHGEKGIFYKFNEESDGTLRLLDLLEILFACEGQTFVVDELDRNLHPRLTYKFIETFLNIATKKNIQLIVTTHESRLLDFDLLRRDEIWFVDKKNNGESKIYSLEEYNARFDQKIDKAYLEGRYGAVPIFG